MNIAGDNSIDTYTLITFILHTCSSMNHDITDTPVILHCTKMPNTLPIGIHYYIQINLKSIHQNGSVQQHLPWTEFNSDTWINLYTHSGCCYYLKQHFRQHQTQSPRRSAHRSAPTMNLVPTGITVLCITGSPNDGSDSNTT